MKYRIWHKCFKKYMPVDEWFVDQDGKVRFLEVGFESNDEFLESPLTEVSASDVVIEMFSGLTDKNGKEIYEGDTVEVSYKTDEHGDPETYISKVVFEDGAFGDEFDNFFNYSFLPSFCLLSIEKI